MEALVFAHLVLRKQVIARAVIFSLAYEALRCKQNAQAVTGVLR